MSEAGSSMGGVQRYNSLQEYAEENRDRLVEILRHSGDNYARGCALAALCETRDNEDIEQVIDELEKEVKK